MKDFFENIRTKWNIAVSPVFAREVRAFAGLEVFCVSVSVLTLLWLAVSVSMSFAGCGQGNAAQSFLGVLLSAAVGYLTNYLAIEMLFKPYEEDKKHLFSILTLGYWRQGLIPKNKHKIGVKTGEVVGGRLLNAEKIADELCSMAGGFLKKKDIISKFREYLRDALVKHEKQMVEYLAPRIEKEISGVSRSILTPEKIQDFVIENVMPFITKDSTRETIAGYVAGSLKERVPGLVEMIREELKIKAAEYIRTNWPIVSGAADAVAAGLVIFVDWGYVRSVIKEKISGGEFCSMVKEEISKLGENLTLWLASPGGRDRMEEFTADMHCAIEKYLHENLADMLFRLADGLAVSEELWHWLETEMLPSVRERIEEFIRCEGKNIILEKLDLENRISKEIDSLKMDEFHKVINDVAAENLGAIQVIGWILGLVIGLVQLIL